MAALHTMVPDALLIGTAGDETLQGAAGNDTIEGGGGTDVLLGGGGNDVITATQLGFGLNVPSLRSRLDGGTGNDILYGGGDGDTLVGGAGADTIYGGAGNSVFVVDDLDTIVEGSDGGTDTVHSAGTHGLDAHIENLMLSGTGNIKGYGNDGDNRITGNSGRNLLAGGDGKDSLFGGAGNDTLKGDNGDDWLRGGVGDDRLEGGGGRDLLEGRDGNDWLAGGAGDDTYVIIGPDSRFVGDSPDYIYEAVDGGIDSVHVLGSHRLGSGVENLTLLGSGDYTGEGNAAANRIVGNAGANSLAGDHGGDNLSGLAGADILHGGDDNDTLSGGHDEDTLLGGWGDDVLVGDSGADRLEGDLGNDTYIVSGADIVVEEADRGIDTVRTDGSSLLTAHVERLVLTGNGASYGLGNDADNEIFGNAASNSLAGGGGNDLLAGGAGDDFLDAGTGRDTLVGGAGADLFGFFLPPGAGAVDVLRDFSTAEDRIMIDAQAFQGLPPMTLSKTAFEQGTVATHAETRLVYDRASGRLYFDADGAGGVSQVQIAEITNRAALTADNFFVLVMLEDSGSGEDIIVGSASAGGASGLAGSDELVFGVDLIRLATGDELPLA